MGRVLQADPSTLPKVFSQAQAGDTIELAGDADYPFRLVITRPITVRGKLGQKPPRIIGNGATELLQDRPNPIVMGQPNVKGGYGLICIASPMNGPKLAGVHLQGLSISGARRENSYTGADGNVYGYGWASGGVHLYGVGEQNTKKGVTINGCQITDCENGIFGKSNGSPDNDLANITVEHCVLKDNGIAGARGDRYHDSYIEGFNTVYQFNTYGDCLWGTSLLADRSYKPIIRYNRFSCSAGMCIGAFEPDDGEPTLTAPDDYGTVWIYGNIIEVLPGKYINRFITFGTTGDGKKPQKTLLCYGNTMVGKNDADPANRRHVLIAVKSQAGQQITFLNNLLANISTDPRQGAGPLRLVAAEYGIPGVSCGINLAPSSPEMGDGGADRSQIITADDPRMVDLAGGNYLLASASPAVGAAAPLPASADPSRPGFLPVEWAWGMLANGKPGWSKVSGWKNLGCCLPAP
jgi:hypothetical protein